MMRNITGSPVEGTDFFDRPRDLERLMRELDNDSHVLLMAPRRVGKTSLVLRLRDLCRQRGWAATFLNVEGCNDELSFAEKLVGSLQEENLHPEVLSRAATFLRGMRRLAGGIKIGGIVDIGAANAEDEEHSTLVRSLESVFRKISADERKVLIVVDEMPELLLNLAKQDNGANRVGELLHWLRGLRQTHRKNIRWVYLGSIGLDNFVDGRNLRKTINDLSPVGLEALREDEADQFLERLGSDNGLPVPPEMRLEIIRRLGWSLPYFLQIVFHALRDLDTKAIDEAAVKQAFASLLRPENLSKFDTWRQRLDEQLSVEDAAAARVILRDICQHADGRTRDQILTALVGKRSHADLTAVEEQNSRLLQLLQHDGYLLQNEGFYSFRSFLLREYWFRREVI